MCRTLIISAVLVSLLIPLSSAIYIEVPDYRSGIASAGVTDVICGRYGDVIFATDSGISVYTANKTWYSVNERHPGETAYGTLAPLNIVVTAVILDPAGRLWIGYPNGLQFQTRMGYESIQDQQFLKNLNVNCMVRWGDEIWVATGRAGLHRYRDGNWTWYKPLGPENLGCYTIVSMAIDAASDALVIGSERDGVWMLRDRTGEVQFEPVACAIDRGSDVSPRIAVDTAGNVYVTDFGRIQKFDGSGNLLAAPGERYAESSCYDDIAIDAAGNIYTVDSRSQCVQKFSSSGNPLAVWGSYGADEGEFRSPAAIAVDASGNVYVTDSGHIQKFDGSGRFLKAWDVDDGVSRFLAAIAVDAAGNVYVTDSGRIQKFDGSGRLLKAWDVGCRESRSPAAIAIDTSGNIHLADTDAGCIRAFDSFGNPLGTWHLRDAPAGIAFDASGNLYVIDRDDRRVQKFAPSPGSYTLMAGWGTGACQEPIQGISEVRADPFGGVYLFNSTTVLRYAPGTGAVLVLRASDLGEFPVVINDVAATSDGMLLIASDNGIYGWEGARVVLHITSGDGIRSNVVKKLFVDAYGRCWFVVPGNVGYLPPMTGSASIDLKPEPVQTTDLPATPTDTPVPEETPAGPPGMLEGIWASLMEWLGKVSRIGGS